MSSISRLGSRDYRSLCLCASVVGLLGALAAQCFLVMRAKSATFDEPFYISAGYAYLTEGRFELNREHPPLMKYLIGFPLLLHDIKPLEEFADWANAPQKRMAFGSAFLFENRTDADAMLFWSRLPVAAVSLLTAALVWAWARRLYGTTASVVALALYALCPNLVAHSSLATLDLGVTAGIFAASYALWRWSAGPKLRWTLIAGAALAAALLMKFSGVAALGVVPLAWAMALGARQSKPLNLAGRKDRRSTGPRDRESANSGFLRATALLVGVLLVAGVLVAVAYGPRHFGLAEYGRGFKLGVLEREKLTQEGYQSFCWGRYSGSGFWYYHLAALLVKMPVPVMLLMAATVARWVWASNTRQWAEWFLAVPIVITLLMTMPIQQNFGLRNVLPVIPFMYVLAGGTAAWLWGGCRAAFREPFVPGVRSRAEERGDKPRGSLVGKGVVLILAAWSAASAARIHPDQLSYFNELVGGPTQGIRYLDDSNIDWGQDLKGLAAFVRERGVHDLRLSYFAGYFLKPAAKHYGLNYEPISLSREIENPRSGWYAVSAHMLQRPKLLKNSSVRFDWLDRFKPEEVIGHSIYVYRFP